MMIYKKYVSMIGCMCLAAAVMAAPVSAQGFDDDYDDDDVIEAPMEPIDIEEYDEGPIVPVVRTPASAASQASADAEAEAQASSSPKKNLLLLNVNGGYNSASYDDDGEFSGMVFGGGVGYFFALGGGNMLGLAAGASYMSGSFENEKMGIGSIDQTGISAFVSPAYRYGERDKYFEAAVAVNIPVSSDPETDQDVGVGLELNGRYKFVSGGVGYSFTETIIPISVRAHVPITQNIEISIPFSYAIGDGWSGWTVSGGLDLVF